MGLVLIKTASVTKSSITRIIKVSKNLLILSLKKVCLTEEATLNLGFAFIKKAPKSLILSKIKKL